MLLAERCLARHGPDLSKNYGLNVRQSVTVQFDYYMYSVLWSPLHTQITCRQLSKVLTICAFNHMWPLVINRVLQVAHQASLPPSFLTWQLART